MTEFSIGLQTFAFLIALVNVILALFVLLDWRRPAHPQLAISLAIMAVNTFALGRLETVAGEDASYLPVLLLALSGPLIVPALLSTLVPIITAMTARRAWEPRLNVVLAAAAALPVVLIVIDVARRGAHLAGAALWFTPLGPRYPGGYVDPSAYTGGILSRPINALWLGGQAFLLLGLLFVIFARRDKSAAWMRHYATLTLVSQALTLLPAAGVLEPNAALIVHLSGSAVFLLAVAVAAFRSRAADFMQEDARGVAARRSINLQTRLTLLALIITLPLLAAMGVLLTEQARSGLEQNALASLAAISRNVVDAGEIWLANSNRILRTLAANSDIQSMDPAQQSKALVNMVSIYPDINLVATVDLEGRDLARSDGRPAEDHSQRAWFQQARRGLPIGFEATPDETGGFPTLTAAAPIRDPNGQVLGVVMFSTRLTVIERLVNSQNAAGTGASLMVIDEENRLVAASDEQYTLMADLHYIPTVQTLRNGKLGAYRYSDSRGDYWNAHLSVLSNDWGVIVLQPERTLFAPIRTFQRVSATVLAIGALILLSLTWFSIRQAMAPVRALTETASAISSGDLSRTAPVYDRDELGLLAQSFNHMTAQLRELITGLEARVSERTRDLERRAVQLQVTSEVARDAAAIHNPDQLLQDAVRLISERFGFYHAGIFFVESGEQAGIEAHASAVLRAASSEGGQRMLQRGHRLAIGDRPGVGQGIVGYVAGSGEPRIALDVGKEPVYFNNPDLPLTRSEMAVPLKIQNRVIGVLDVQSRKPAAFDDQDLATMQVLANQLVVAIENAELIDESRRALNELETLYGRQVERGWQQRIGDQPLVYRMKDGQVAAGPEQATEASSRTGEAPGDDPRTIEAPIELRTARLGALRLRRGPDQEGWSAHDRELAEQAVARLAQALENARLMAEIQNRAHQEELINQMVSRTQSTLHLDGVLRTVVEEIVRVVNTSRVQIMLRPGGNGSAGDSAAVAGGDDPVDAGMPPSGGRE